MSNIIRSEQDFLTFIADEATPNGNLSIRGVARCCGVDRSYAAIAELESLRSWGRSPLKQYLGVVGQIEEISASECLRIISYFAGNPAYSDNKFCKLIYDRFVLGKLCGEKYWQSRLLKPGNKVEVVTDLGVADIITSTHVVEVKKASDAHKALGQVLAYSHALGYPLMPAVVCFGDINPSKMAILSELFAVNSVELYHVTEDDRSVTHAVQGINQFPGLWRTSCVVKKNWEMAHCS